MSLMDWTTPSTTCTTIKSISHKVKESFVYLVLDTRVLALSVLTDENSIHVVICSFVALDRDTRADVREEVEGATEGKVERDVTLANWI
jgi:hypothetical protein